MFAFPSDAGDSVEAAAASAEAGESAESAPGGSSQRGGQQGVLRALLWDAKLLQVRLLKFYA